MPSFYNQISHLYLYRSGGDAKFDELQEDGKVDLSKVHDPYLAYGGSYKGDHKDTKDFKYITFDIVPAFTTHHKSLMSKVLTPELFEKLKDVRSSKGFTLSNVIMTGVVTPHLGDSIQSIVDFYAYISYASLTG